MMDEVKVPKENLMPGSVGQPGWDGNEVVIKHTGFEITAGNPTGGMINDGKQ